MKTSTGPWPDFPAPGEDGGDSLEMCFSQGKACVYMSDDHSRIVTEWPNGGVDELVVADKSRTRKWPDGRIERLLLTPLCVHAET